MHRVIICVLISYVFFIGCDDEKKGTSFSTNVNTRIDSGFTSIDTSNRKSEPELDCGYDNEVISLGIGLVSFGENFSVYRDSLLTIKECQGNVFNEEQCEYCSLFKKRDYGIYEFVCLQELDNAYKILVNADEVKYVPKSKDHVFATWENYIVNGSPIHVSEMYDIKVFDKPDSTSNKRILLNDKTPIYCCLAMEGDWIKIKYDCSNDDDATEAEIFDEKRPSCLQTTKHCKNTSTGWVRWRDKEKLLITILLAC